MAVVMGPYVMVGMDEPEHKRHRHLVSHAFRSKALAHWEDDLITDVIDELIDELRRATGSAELVREFTFRFPVQVIAEVLGVPRDDNEKFHQWAVDDHQRGRQSRQRHQPPARDARVPRRLRRGAPPGARRPMSSATSSPVRSTASCSTTRRSTRSCGCCCPRAPRRPTAPSGNFLLRAAHAPRPAGGAAWPIARSCSRRVEEAIRWESPLLITNRRVHGRHRSRRRGDPRRRRRDRPRRLGQPRRVALGPRRGLRHHAASRSRRSPSASDRTCASACTWPGSSSRWRSTGILDRLPNLRLDPDGDDPHIHGERFRSPTSLPVLFG